VTISRGSAEQPPDVWSDSLTAMTDVGDTLDRIDAATSRLLATCHGLSEDDVRRPSLLPGWTVGHVLTHIARNADSLVNLATWASTGVVTPQYASPEARDADIEAGAGRPVGELVEDVAASAERLRGAMARMTPEHYEAEVEWRGGARKPARVIPSARLTEVEVHHADLGLGYGFGDIPEPLRVLLLADAVEGWADADGVVLQAEDMNLTLPEGREPKVLVTGTSGDLLGWAGGRTSGETLRCDGPLPAVPEWR
jgi:maleylpyruvate isomerase